MRILILRPIVLAVVDVLEIGETSNYTPSQVDVDLMDYLKRQLDRYEGGGQVNLIFTGKEEMVGQLVFVLEFLKIELGEALSTLKSGR